MNILIQTPHFHPENFKCNEMAFELQKKGYNVTVMTAIPDYPKGTFYKGYGFFKKRRETIEGVRVHRSLIIPRGKGSPFRLALNYISYVIFASLKALYFGLTKKFDAIIVHETSPVLVGVPAVIIKKMQKIPLYFWVLDLWPESLSAAGGIKNRHILSFFDALTKWLYKNSTTILIGSKGFRQSINSKGDFNDKIIYFPNWVEDSLNEVKKIEVPLFRTGFNILIAGNMGEAQDLPHILKAFAMLKDYPIYLNLVGEGRKKEYVKKFITENQLDDKVFLYGRYPLEAMPSFFAQSDVLLMALKDNPIFSLTVPSRLQAYMSSGKPIIAMINGEGARLINEADCGWSVSAEKSEELANLLISISELNKDILSCKGRNGKKYSETYFKFSKCIDDLVEIMKIREKT